MNGNNIVGFGLTDDIVQIEIRTRVGAEHEQLISTRGCGGGFINVRGGHNRLGIEHLRYGTTNAPGRDTPVGNKNALPLDLFEHLFKGLRLHGIH